MQLQSILPHLKVVRVDGPADCEISSIAYDSRKVQKGALFIALRGDRQDGRNFVGEAIERGAAAVVSDEAELNKRGTLVTVTDTRAAMADAAAAFYGSPAASLKVAGVTGTNGKTTTVYLLKAILEKAMLRCGLIGTVRYEIGERILPASRTTPESADLQELLYQIRSAGCRAAVMEVSSHALMQHRVRGVEFDAAIFTNLTQDHLDYHKTMDAYFEAKASLFTGLDEQKRKPGKSVVNADERYGQRLIEMLAGKKSPVISYGMNARADFRASGIKIDFSGTSYQLDANGKSYLVRLPLIGRFNVYNSLAAIAGAWAMGVDIRTSVLAMASAPAVPGRLEAVSVKRQFKVFVDYAHTDDALKNVMRTLRDLGPNRLIVVFGCGGSRDKAKRPLMAAAVDEHADYTIVTSDNPRKEEPEAIIEDIKKGFRRNHYEVIIDRKEAIFRAISIAEPRDIVLIAGKGHENYQEFADHTIPFDDLAVARWAIEGKSVEMEG